MTIEVFSPNSSNFEKLSNAIKNDPKISARMWEQITIIGTDYKVFIYTKNIFKVMRENDTLHVGYYYDGPGSANEAMKILVKELFPIMQLTVPVPKETSKELRPFGLKLSIDVHIEKDEEVEMQEKREKLAEYNRAVETATKKVTTAVDSYYNEIKEYYEKLIKK
jgi:hypothetical protein